MCTKMAGKIFVCSVPLLPITMVDHSHCCLTYSFTRQESFGGQLPPCSQLAQQTLSANSELSEESVCDIEVVRFNSLAIVTQITSI